MRSDIASGQTAVPGIGANGRFPHPSATFKVGNGERLRWVP
jgi:hypothetical protein